MATCTLTGTILYGNGEVLEGAYIYAVPYDSPAIINGTGEVVATETIWVLSTSTGEFELDLIQNVKFTVIIPEIGFRKTITVPETSTGILWELTDLFVTGDSTPSDSGETNW